MQTRPADSRFIAALGEVMQRTGLKPQTLANDSGTDPSVISRWLNGKTRRPSPESVATFAAGLIARHPDTADLIPGLFEALGYVPVMPELPPQPVRDHWDDPDVRKLWSLSASPERRLEMIVAALDASAGNPIPADAPYCTFERAVLNESGLSPEAQAQMIRAHRISGHTFCHRLGTERGEVPRTALSGG